MVWIWIIVAIVVIALIVWFLLSRRKGAQVAAGQAPVGRHIAASDRATETSEAGTKAADEQPVFDQEAGGDAATAADPHEAATQAIPVTGGEDADGEGAGEPEPVLHTTGSTGDEQVVASGSAAADADAADRAATDAEIAAENDDPVARPADAPPESAAAAAHHEDTEFADTPVEHPVEGEVAAAESDDEGTPASAEEEDEDLGRPADAGEEADAEQTDAETTDAEATKTEAAADDTTVEPPADEQPVAAAADEQSDAPGEDTPDQVEAGEEAPAEAASDDDAPDEDTPVSASAGQAAGYAVARADDSAPTPGADPMTERFGAGAVSPRPDGSAPEGHPIKGNADSMLFHTPDSPRYDATNPAVWFADEAAATSAGFAHWDRTKRGGAIPAATTE